jgi:hypothetical protein
MHQGGGSRASGCVKIEHNQCVMKTQDESNCHEDGGRPSAIVFQEKVANRLETVRVKSRCWKRSRKRRARHVR